MQSVALIETRKATVAAVTHIAEGGVWAVASTPRSELEDTVKSLLCERSMSMRRLAMLTGINVGTISKMVRGKQRANPEYLQKMAQCLAVPPDVLFTAAGFDIGNQGRSENANVAALDMIRDVMQYLGLRSEDLSRSDIERELDKYESYAKTPEGQDLIIEKYVAKRQQIVGSGPFVDDLDKMYERFVRSDVAAEERAILGSALLYFVLATDAIPDYMFPIGYVDDVVAVHLTHKRLSRLHESTSHRV